MWKKRIALVLGLLVAGLMWNWSAATAKAGPGVYVHTPYGTYYGRYYFRPYYYYTSPVPAPYPYIYYAPGTIPYNTFYFPQYRVPYPYYYGW